MRAILPRQYLRSFPIQSVDLIQAGIALYERRIIRGQAGPRAKCADSSQDILKADYFLDLVIANSHPEKRCVSTEGVETYVLTISGPGWTAEICFGQFRPRYKSKSKSRVESVERVAT
jgi:hypothetical protein